jgi:hypothetical protein
MTLFNLEKDINFAVRTSAGKLVFTCESEDRARQHASKVFPEWETADEPWSIIKITTQYELVR